MKNTLLIAGKTFQSDGGDGWHGEIEVQGWAAKGAACTATIHISSKYYDDENEPQPQPTPEQCAAVEFLVKNHASLIAKGLNAALTYVREFVTDDFYGEEYSIETVDDVRDNVSEPDFLINCEAVDGVAWIGLSAGCEWDDEHALGIAFWKNIILDIGYADVAFSTPYGGFQLNDEEQAERDRVIAAIQQIAEVEDEVAQNEYIASLPLSIRLVQAICNQDHDEAQRLRDAGARVNDVPKTFAAPIFFALNYQDPRVVAAMIAEGALLDVRNEMGQTPIEFAQQMVKTFALTARMQAGDPGAMRDLMREFNGGNELDIKDPLAESLNMLAEIQEAGGELAAAAENMSGMFDKLSGGFAAMSGESAEKKKYYDGIQSDTQKMSRDWSEILKVLKRASV